MAEIGGWEFDAGTRRRGGRRGESNEITNSVEDANHLLDGRSEKADQKQVQAAVSVKVDLLAPREHFKITE